MAKHPRKKSPAQTSESNPQTAPLVQDSDPTDCIMEISFGAEESVGILVAWENKEVISKALEQSRGRDAIIQHLHALDVSALLGANEMLHEALIRRQDVRLLEIALEQCSSAEYITLLIANAVVHALFVSKRHTDIMVGCGEAVTQNQLEQKQNKYRRGPDARAKKRQDRVTLIQQYRSEGITNARKILDKLRQDAPQLAKVEIKTIKNMLADL